MVGWNWTEEETKYSLLLIKEKNIKPLWTAKQQAKANISLVTTNTIMSYAPHTQQWKHLPIAIFHFFKILNSQNCAFFNRKKNCPGNCAAAGFSFLSTELNSSSFQADPLSHLTQIGKSQVCVYVSYVWSASRSVRPSICLSIRPSLCLSEAHNAAPVI